MKKHNIFMASAFGIILSASLGSCVSDDPFSGDGEGMVRMRMVINSEVTRAETDADALRENCIVYISNQKGLIRKYKGLQELPENIPLKSGKYVAEAWTGDSVPASFDKKFYRGYQPFDVVNGVTPVTLNCKIANVVASVNPAILTSTEIQDWKITISNSTGTLDFTKDNVADAKGYFMMPFDFDKKVYESELKYVISGKNATGKAFTKEGVISDVKKAHEYTINLEYNPTYDEIGGAFINVTIDDKELLVKSEVEILGAPAISGVGFDIDKQIYAEPGQFSDVIVKVSNFGDLHFLRLQTDDYSAFGLPQKEVGLMMLTDKAKQDLNDLGLRWEVNENLHRGTIMTEIYLEAKMLNKLPKRDTEYVVTVYAEDSAGKATSAELHIAVGEDAIIEVDPIKVEDPTGYDKTAIKSTVATIPINILADDVEGAGIRFHESGTQAWTSKTLAELKVSPRALSRAGTTIYITLRNLKPDTHYELQATWNNGSSVSDSFYFDTEPCFTIPNASMEEWSKYSENSKVVLPSGNGQRTFWDTGNHGSATLSRTITDGSTDMFHTGTKSARLNSQYIVVKFAAGNIFAGEYVGTDETDGILSLGRPFDGSHPSALSVYVNYRPCEGVNRRGANSKYIAAGDLDKGQIYVALSTQPVEIRTKNASKLFDPKSSEILAYGEYTFDSNYGPDGALQELRIPLTYYERAKQNNCAYLIIVCTASKYGDYFSGGENSTMYLDDFQLIYE